MSGFRQAENAITINAGKCEYAAMTGVTFPQVMEAVAAKAKADAAAMDCAIAVIEEKFPEVRQHYMVRYGIGGLVIGAGAAALVTWLVMR